MFTTVGIIYNGHADNVNNNIDATVAQTGRGLPILKRCAALLTTISTRQALQALRNLGKRGKEELGKITTGPGQGSTAGP